MNGKLKKVTKALVVLMSAVLILSCFGVFAKPQTANAGLLGDINEDGVVNSRDLSMLQKIIIGTYVAPETTPTPTHAVINTPTPTSSVTATPIPQRTPTYVAPPYYNEDHFYTIEELKTWINSREKNDHERPAEWIKAIAEDGGMLVPYVGDLCLLDILENGIRITFGAENWVAEGKGYSYRFMSKELSGICWIYLIDKEDQQAAKEDFASYHFGKYGKISDEQKEAINQYMETFEVNGVSYSGYHYESGEGYPDRERLHFIYNDRFVVHFDLFDTSEKDVFEVAKTLRFEIEPIEVKEIEDPITVVNPTKSPSYIKSFKTTEEFKAWIEDENKEYPERSQTLIDEIKDEGGIYVPTLDGKDAEMFNVYAYFGHENTQEKRGYSYSIDAYKDEEYGFFPTISFYAIENPQEIAEALAQSTEQITLKNGQTYSIIENYRYGKDINHYIYFVFNDKYLVRIYNSQLDIKPDLIEFAKKLDIEFLPVEL
ncbi:MAG: hypothetical protein IJF80_00940 [Clostridia bacterium]|nr:hypothetical protein [Clostridia bacterium]